MKLFNQINVQTGHVPSNEVESSRSGTVWRPIR